MPESQELSERELEILRLLATGVSNKEIASQLSISANTVKVHLRKIFSKIGVASRTEAALYAVDNGLVSRGAPAGKMEALEPAGLPAPDDILENGLLSESNGAQVAALPARQRSSWAWAGLVSLLVLTVALLGYTQWLRSREQAAAPVPPAFIPEVTGTPRWQGLAGLPTPRSGLALAAYDNQLYAIGGETAAGVTGLTERYDAQTNQWSPLQSKPTAVGDVGAAVIGGKIYVPGGRLEDGTQTDLLEIYDPRQDQWETGARLPVALSAYALASFEGRIFLFGGWDGSRYVASVYEYDPGREAWAARTPLPQPRGFAGAVVFGDKIYVVGGYDGRKALQNNDRYSPGDDQPSGDPWEPMKPLPEGRYAMGVAGIADILYVIGGESGGRQLSPMEYLVPRDQWETFQSPEAGQWSRGGLAIIGTNLHAVGGLQGGSLSASHLSYKAIYIINIPGVFR